MCVCVCACVHACVHVFVCVEIIILGIVQLSLNSTVVFCQTLCQTLLGLFFRRKKLYVERGRRVAAAAGCHVYKYDEMLKCLRNKNTKELVQLARKPEFIDYMV